MENIEGISRSGMCAGFNENNVGQTVTLMGWAGKVRDIGQLVFIDLRDRSGVMQLVIEQEDEALLKKAQSVHLEYVIAAVGEIRLRSSINPNIPTGKVEVKVKELRVLSKSEPLPVQENAKEENRLQYRYLDLRRPEMQENFLLRHKVATLARNYYSENGFLEIETPVLIKSTPEGARDYLVPSRVHP
ncbi:MAG: amino acid--tRNA ligase-related protein, partial [Bacillota bacterium]|nr:amino acid--tRNA ligase-related protein [Bacillota bacterium]